MSVKILLVDDHRLLLKGLRLQLEQVYGLEVVGEASCGWEALNLARELSPDLAVLDLHLPDMTGKELARQLLAEHPRLKLLILSSDSDIAQVKETLKIGVAGYLLKENTDQDLFQAIRQIMSGQTYLCSEVNAAILTDYKKTLSGEAVLLKPGLSEREREVLRLIAEGLRTKEIASRMDVGVKSVETYRRRLTDKLGLTSTAELTRYAVREGIAAL